MYEQTTDINNIRRQQWQQGSSVGKRSNNKVIDMANNNGDNNTESKKVSLESSQGKQVVISMIDSNVSFYLQEDALRARNFKEIN